jgi:hypothetical protein
MKFDSSLAWRQASAAVSANRAVLVPMAGVFFMLPRLLLSLMMPEPPVNNGASTEEMMAQMQQFYAGLLPYAIPMMLFQAAGTLGILTLFADRSRPTVGEAIKLGARGVFPYLLSQILFGFAATLALGVVLGALNALKTPSTLIAAVAGVGLIALLVAFVRIALVAPVIAVERIYNPVAALRRSWDLTRGNAGRLAVFLGLIVVVALVALGASVAIIGSLSTLIGGHEVGQIVAAALTALLAAVLALYMAAILAAAHRQLAGPDAQDLSATFE